MSFPTHDRHWMTAADFVRSHLKAGERVIAPLEFQEVLPEAAAPISEASATEPMSFQWAVIHKGTMQASDRALLNRISNEFMPLFANEVFVIFWKSSELPAIDSRSPHFHSFCENLHAINTRRNVPRAVLRRSVSILPRFVLQLPRVLKKRLSRSSVVSDCPATAKAAAHHSDSEPPNYSKLTVDQLRRAMDARYSAGNAYVSSMLWDDIRGKDLNEKVLDFAGSLAGRKVLEIGCGTGGRAEYIDVCDQYIGTDLSEAAISQAQERYKHKANFIFVAMDATNLTFLNASFDVVFAVEVIEHLLDADKCIQEVYRVLTPGGLFVLTSPNRDSLHLRVNRMLGYQDFICSFDHVKEYTFTEVASLLQASGFVVEKTAGSFLQPYWGIPNIDQHVRHLTDNDPVMVEMLKDLGRRVGAEYAFCYVISARKPRSP